MEPEATYTNYLGHRQRGNRNLLNLSNQTMPKKLQFFGEERKTTSKVWTSPLPHTNDHLVNQLVNGPDLKEFPHKNKNLFVVPFLKTTEKPSQEKTDEWALLFPKKVPLQTKKFRESLTSLKLTRTSEGEKSH